MSSELDSDKEDVILVDKKEKSDNKEDGSKKSDKNGTILYTVSYKFLQFHSKSYLLEEFLEKFRPEKSYGLGILRKFLCRLLLLKF